MGDVVNLTAIHIANFIGVLICVSILTSRALKERLKAEKDAKYILLLVIMVMSICIADSLSFEFIGGQGFLSYYIVYVTSLWIFVANLLLGALWVVIIVTYMVGHFVNSQKFFVLGTSVLGSFLILFNFFNPVLFDIDENNIYHRGPMYWLFTVIQVSFIVYGIVLYLVLKHRDKANAKYFPIIQFLYPVIIGLAIQTIFYGISLAGVSIAISLGALLYGVNSASGVKIAESLYKEETRIQHTHLISMLTDRFIEMYYLEPMTGKYAVYSKQGSEEFSQQLAHVGSSGNIYELLFGNNNHVHPDDIPICKKVFNYNHLTEIITSRKRENVDIRWNGKDGYTWIRLKLVSFKDVGASEYVAVVVEEATEIKKNTIKSQNENKALIAVMENFVSMYQLDLENMTFTVIKEADEKTTEMFKEGEIPNAENVEAWIRENVEDNDIERLCLESKVDRIKERLSQSRGYEILFQQKVDGTLRHRAVRLSRNPDYEESSKVFFGLYDINDSMDEQKANLIEYKKKFESATEENNSKTDFLYKFSRDIRTPLDAVSGYAQMAMKNMVDLDKVRSCLENINIASGEMSDLVNRVSEITHIEKGEYISEVTRANIVERGNAMVSFSNAKASKKGMSITFKERNISNPNVYIDRIKMSQILNNVIENAVKYTPEGGMVNCTLEQLPYNKEEFGLYEFVVEDSGIGMSAQFLERVFDDFSRDASAIESGIEGTGLGLSITKKLVDSLNGEIKVESTQGIGTKVRIKMPLKFTVEQEVQNVEVVQDADKLKGKRILVVEDNEMNREIVKEILEQEGFVVEETYDGDLALSKVVEEASDHYDLILMDVNMPRMNGYDATKAIRSLYDKEKASVPIVAMTADAFEKDKELAINAGMNEHVAKPVDIDVLLDVFNKIL